jgi:hypothetical protein
VALIDLFIGRVQRLDDAEDELGTPSEAEAKDLALHVARCPTRWTLVYRMQRAASGERTQIKFILFRLVAVMLVYVGPGSGVQAIWKMLGF